MKRLSKWTVVLYLILAFSIPGFAQAYKSAGITFTPIRHATFIIQTDQLTIFIDPVGSIDAFKSFPKPDIILITDIHGDHLKPDVISNLKQPGTVVIGPKAVIDKLPAGQVLNNGEQKNFDGLSIKAIAAYNLSPDRMKFHNKGRGNGYVLTLNQKRIYISGDTEDVPEMRQLKNIDFAFVCMNLPYTMTVEQAASAVLEFQPKMVLPYHYRGKAGLSDLNKFQLAVNKNPLIEVKQLKWY